VRRAAQPRRCWIALTPPFDGLGRGWRRLVHNVSHMTYRRTHPRTKPHGGGHATLEAQMVAYIIARGWLTGTLKPKAKAPAAGTRTHARSADRTRNAGSWWPNDR
jgi:hypothetical protein